MAAIVADTHSILWFLENDRRLTKAAALAMSSAIKILLPSICLVEMTYLIEKGRLNAAALPRVFAELDKPATPLQLAALDLEVARAMQQISRSQVPDMPDRIVAATAYFHCLPLVTCDGEIRSCGI